MCLSTVYALGKDSRRMVARNVADVRFDGGKLILTDLMGVRTILEAQLERVDLMENEILIREQNNTEQGTKQ